MPYEKNIADKIVQPAAAVFPARAKMLLLKLAYYNYRAYY